MGNALLKSGQSSEYVERINNAEKNGNLLSELSAQATSITKGINEMFTKQGTVIGSLDTSTGVRANTPGILPVSASGSVGISHQNSEKESYNLVRSEVKRGLAQVAAAPESDRQAVFDNNVTSRVENYRDMANGKSSLHFGKNAAVGAVVGAVVGDVQANEKAAEKLEAEHNSLKTVGLDR